MCGNCRIVGWLPPHCCAATVTVADSRISSMQRSDVVLKGIGVDSPFAHCRTVVIDGLWRVEQQCCYFYAFSHAQTYKCVDAQLCGQSSLV